MSTEGRELARLLSLASLKRDAQSRRLGALNAEIERLQHQVARMRRAVGTRSRDLELDPSRMSGADVLWTRRTEQQISLIQARLARLFAEREGATAEARLAFGKCTAVEALLERHRASTRKTRPGHDV